LYLVIKTVGFSLMDLLAQTRTIDIIQVVKDLGFALYQYRKLRCPFHEENTPSLLLYPQTNTYHCFGCGKHGDVINFYASATGQEYTAAMHELAFNYLPSYQPERYKRGSAALKKIQPVTKPAGKKTLPPDTKTYVYKPLHSTIYADFQRICGVQPLGEIGEEAWRYLLSRGFTEPTLRRFQIFTVNDYDAAQAHLRNTYSLLDLQESGLFNERGNLIFYRHVIIIPYYRKGQLVYLQGRLIGNPPGSLAKYQFLSGVPVELFNVDMLEKVKTGKVVYLTEGAFDCMTLVQQGMPAVSLGSATLFKREWAKAFMRFEVVFNFDNDKAGQKAAHEFADLFAQHRISTHVQQVKAGFKDVNEYWQQRDQ